MTRIFTAALILTLAIGGTLSLKMGDDKGTDTVALKMSDTKGTVALKMGDTRGAGSIV